jgi:hypothetical protein
MAMRKAAILLIVLGLLVDSSDGFARVIRDGNSLLQVCNSDSDNYEILCSAYIEGVADVITRYSSVGDWESCIREDQSMEQIKSVILLKLNQSPALLQYDAASVILAILDESFPCSG